MTSVAMSSKGSKASGLNFLAKKKQKDVNNSV